MTPACGSSKRRSTYAPVVRSLQRVGPDVAAGIDDLPRIVSFRNVLIHGYATVDDAIVWEVATERLVELVELLTGLLDDG